MGVGKSTIGRQLAAHMDMTFVDSDHEVERLERKSISDIFQDQGEETFRQLETKVLDQVTLSTVPQVIATGGGIVIQPENRLCIIQRGFVVWLNVSPEAIYRRLRSGHKNRPLLQQNNPRKKLQKLYSQRVEWYRSCCDVEICSADLTPRQVVDQISRCMAEFGHDNTTLSGQSG